MQGQGLGTARKEDGFAAIFRQSLRLSRGVLKYPYWHLDVNSGTGRNDKVGCYGSPIVFLKEAMVQGRQHNAFFCDKDSDSTGALTNLIREHGFHGASVWTCDNAKATEEFAKLIREAEKKPQFSVGTILCDPNGWRDFPREKLVEFSKEFKRIDLVLNLNIGLLARVRGAVRSGKPSNAKALALWPDLEGVVSAFDRSDWLIRNPNKRGARFVMLVGRSIRCEPFDDFYSISSWQGQEILNEYRRVDSGQLVLPFME